MCAASQLSVWLSLEPAALKICIGIVQVLVVIEIMLRVRQTLKSTNTLVDILPGQAMLNELMASMKKVDKIVRISQIIVTCFIIMITVGSSIYFLLVDLRNSNYTQTEDRVKRANNLKSAGKLMAFIFLFLGLSLTVSVFSLIYVLKTELRKNQGY